MLLSIITINLNNAAGLARTIGSVLPLLGNDVEYIVLDGQSNDDSAAVMQRETAGHPQVRTRVQRDSGIYDAMNQGLRMARGRYVAYINSGDELIGDNYRAFLAHLAVSDADVCYAKTLIRSVDGSQTRIHERHPEHLVKHSIPHPTAATRRELMLSHGGFDESFRIVADRDLFVRLRNAGARFEFFDAVTTIFEEGGASSSHRTRYEDILINGRYGHISPARYRAKLAIYHVQRWLKALDKRRAGRRPT